MRQAIIDIFSPFGLRPQALITRYVAHYAISAIECTLDDRCGYIGTVPGDLRSIIRNCVEVQMPEKVDGIDTTSPTVAGFYHSFSGKPATGHDEDVSITFYCKYGVAHREHEPYCIVKHTPLSNVVKKWAMYGEYTRDHNMPQRVIWDGNWCIASWIQAVGDGYTTCGVGTSYYFQHYPKILLRPDHTIGSLVERRYTGQSMQEVVLLTNKPHVLRNYLYPDK